MSSSTESVCVSRLAAILCSNVVLCAVIGDDNLLPENVAQSFFYFVFLINRTEQKKNKKERSEMIMINSAAFFMAFKNYGCVLFLLFNWNSRDASSLIEIVFPHSFSLAMRVEKRSVLQIIAVFFFFCCVYETEIWYDKTEDMIYEWWISAEAFVFGAAGSHVFGVEQYELSGS